MGFIPTDAPWKSELLENGAEVFSRTGRAAPAREQAAREMELYEQIGRLKMELEWLKKKLPASTEVKRGLIEPGHRPERASAMRTAGVDRATWYYEPRGESAGNLRLMRLIDEQFLRTPFYGVPRMTEYLPDGQHAVNRKRVQRLMRLMGLEAIYPKPRTTLGSRDQSLSVPTAWRRDRAAKPGVVNRHHLRADASGFMYLVAILDWYSRYVLTWQLSNTLDDEFCVETLEEALQLGGRRSSTRTRACSSRPKRSRVGWRPGHCVSMDGEGGPWTTCSWNDCGGR